MYNIEQSSKFKRDLKKYAHDKNKLIALNDVVKSLETDGSIPEKYNSHPLKGNYSGTLECHIQNDFLLIWIDKDSCTIKLVRLGTHSELFK